jgi:hypothetical protein
MEDKMRYRKSIRIMKGVRLNFSKSGMSLTAGVRGASINVGPRGTYLNTGIPGTGLYDRKRISGPSYSSSRSSSSRPSYTDISITMGINDAGQEFIKDDDGNLITDDSLLRKIKRSDTYKAKMEDLRIKFLEDKEKEGNGFIEIYKLSPSLISEESVRNELAQLKPQEYQINSFDGKKPEASDIKPLLVSEAKTKIKSILFWTLKKKRNDYVESELPERLNKAIQQYEAEKASFDENERQTKIAKDIEYLSAYEHDKTEMESFLSGSQEWVEKKIESFLKDMTLPVNFSVSYEYDAENGGLKIDLDLPEIEDLPKQKASQLSSGKIKVKDKTQKELKEEYLRCICGLAFFFASSFFNVSSHIGKVLISGYSQRLSKKTGKVEDEYLYSVVFDREHFSTINIKLIDPIAAIDGFTNHKEVSKTFEIQAITPMESY